MLIQRAHAFAIVFALNVVLATSSAWGDPQRPGDPAAPSSTNAAGVFGEGASSSAAPDPVSGIMRYSYPFELSEARGRVQPALALTYSSASRDREAGYGWGLDLPTIERRPMSGNPRFDGTASDERFFYNGKPLVRVCELPSCPAGEVHPSWATSGWRYYRLQVEGLFARFYLSPNRRQWLVQKKGGLQMEFGSNDGSLDAVDTIGGDPDKIVRWRITRELDAVYVSGGAPLNFVEYRWKKLGTRGLSYLTDIFDTPRASGHATTIDFAHHTELVWESPDYEQTSYVDPLHATPDLRLKRVGVSSKTWEASGAREVVRVYMLQYAKSRSTGNVYVPGSESELAPLWHHSFLKSITKEGACRQIESADGHIPLLSDCQRLPPTMFEYSAMVHDARFTRTAIENDTSNVVGQRRVLFDEESAAIVDMNRDGFPDVIQSWHSGPRCNGVDGFSVVGSSSVGVADRIGCVKSNGQLHSDVGASRLMVGYFGRGRKSDSERARMRRECIDGGFDIDSQFGRSPASVNSGYPAAFFTPQGGVTLPGSWSTGAAMWLPQNIPGFHPKPYVLEPTNRGYGVSSSGCDPNQFDVNNYNPPWQWRPSDEIDWAKSGEIRPLGTGVNWYADIDGDGLLDEIVERSGSPIGPLLPAYVHFTRRFAANEPGGEHHPVQRPFQFSPTPSLVPAPGRPDTRYIYVDINGDGIVDLVTLSSSSNNGIPRIRLGDGYGSFGCIAGRQPWECLPENIEATSGYDISIASPLPRFLSATTAIHDVTGDGLADIVEYRPDDVNGAVYLWVNVDGRRFECANPLTGCIIGTILDDRHLTFDLGEHRISFADMDANGVDDLVVLATSGIYVVSLIDTTFDFSGFRRAPRPGLLTVIDNGLGATTSISYNTIQELDVGNTGTLVAIPSGWRHHSRAVEAVVSAITVRRRTDAPSPPYSVPYEFHRDTKYRYEDPAYDRWERKFVGFRKVISTSAGEAAVTATTYWFGPCQNDSLFEDPNDSNDRASRRCYYTSDDDSSKGVTGRPIRVDRFIPAGREDEQWLWSRQITWESHVTSTDERSIYFSYPASTKTTLYDGSQPVVPSPQIPGQLGSDPIEPPPTQAGAKITRRLLQYDEHGNLVRAEDGGLVEEDDTRVVRVLSNRPPDGFSQLPFIAPSLACSEKWVCNPTHIATFGAGPGPNTLGAYQPLRQLRLRYEFPGNAGNITSVEAFASGSSVIPRPPGTNSPPGASGFGFRVLSTASYDAWGNLTRTEEGPDSPSPICKTFSYDKEYRHLPSSVRRHPHGCASPALVTDLVFDRGFSQVVAVADPSKALTTIELDPFGRTQRIFLPERNGLPGLTTLAAQFTYWDASPLSAIDTKIYSSPTSSTRSIVVSNGLGESVLEFQQGDAPSNWVLQHNRRDSAGRPMFVYHPMSFTGDPIALAMNAVSPPTSSDYIAYGYDGFGRLLGVRDVAVNRLLLSRTYRPLVVEERDAEQLKLGGPHAGAFTRYERDGHGRIHLLVQHVDGANIVTTVDHLPTGEVTRVRKSYASTSVERSMEYDSLGRLVRNVEPNTGEWHYAWDDAGRLVGTSDARGCGKNVHYDGIGRVLGEDYVPCLPSHEPYSAPNPLTGDGFEAFYRYDTYEPGQVSAEPGFLDAEGFAAGRLTAVRDRGSHSRLNYDALGRVRRVSRRVTKPQGSGGDPYVAKWLTQRLDFDSLGHLTRKTSGADVPELTQGGASEETYSYSPQGRLLRIDSSFGPIITDTEYEFDGLVRRVRYGDAAQTEASFGYDKSYARRLEQYDVSRSAPGLWSSNQLPDYPKPNWETTQTELARFRYVYDEVGNPLRSLDLVSASQYQGVSKYLPIQQRDATFDDLYRLRRVEYGYATSNNEASFESPYLPELVAGDSRPVPLQLQHPTRVRKQLFSYDFMGNIATSSDDLNASYDRSIGRASYGTATDGPNQLRKADGIEARHDEAGNLVELKVSRVGDCIMSGGSYCAQWFAYDWDEVGQLLRARRWDFKSSLPLLPTNVLPSTPPTWTLSYAYSQGQRVLKSDRDSSGKERHTVDVFDTFRMLQVPFQGDSYQHHKDSEVYFAGGSARIFYDFSHMLPSAPGAEHRHMYLRIGDHLGTTAAVIERASGELVERTSSQAFGALESDYRPERWHGSRDAYKFTGKEEDIEVGLTYFGARYYQPHLGQWASADPLSIHGLGSDLNPYAYVGGRVLSYVDPFGFDKIPDNATNVRYHKEGWSAIVNGTLEVGTYEPSHQHHAVGAMLGLGDSPVVSVALDIAIGRGEETRIPLGGGSYITPGGVLNSIRANGAMSALPFGLGDAMQMTWSLIGPASEEDERDKSGLVGVLTTAVIQGVITGRVSGLGAAGAKAAGGGGSALVGVLRARALRLGGFAERGAPIILDENLAARGVAEALRAQGFNVRSVAEVFGRNGIKDPVIRQYAGAVGARVLTADRGRQIGEGFGQLAIHVNARVGPDAAALGRILAAALQ